MNDSCTHLSQVADVPPSSDHPIIQSYEPGEDWWWCYIDDLAFAVHDAPSFAHP